MSHDLEDRLRAGLDAEARSAPPEPALGDVIDQCGRDLTRHHRRLAVAAVGAAAAAVLVALALPSTLGGAPDEARVAGTGRPLSDAELIDTCRAGSQPAYWTELVFGSGTPRVAARSAPGTGYSTTILVSADGAYWADCFNAENAYANTPGALSDEPGRSSMTVFENRTSQNLPPFSAGGACPGGRVEECDRFSVDYADRLPSEVAAVEFTTVDGRTTRVDTTPDGFVVFDYEGETPARVQARATQVRWFTKIVYLDASGTPVAANQVEGGYLTGKVEGLPPLADYPSLARQVMTARPPEE